MGKYDHIKVDVIDMKAISARSFPEASGHTNGTSSGLNLTRTCT